MARRLIKRGTRRIPAAVQSGQSGDGWVNLVAPGTSNPYFFPVEYQRITVTASGCGGVRIYDWGKNANLYTESTSGGTLHCATAVASGVGYGPVVRVLNPTENTEVTILSETIPPPLLRRTFARLVGWLPWR